MANHSAAETEQVLRRFRAEWNAGASPSFGEYLRVCDDEDYVCALIAIDLEYRWKKFSNRQTREADSEGIPQFPLIEDYGKLLGASQLLTHLSDILASEYRARSLWGDRPDQTEYITLFPELTDDQLTKLKAVELELSVARASVASIDTSSQVAGTNDTVSWQPNVSPVARSSKQQNPPMIGKYQTQRLLGRGAFGEVWLAEHPQLRRLVAIKTSRKDRSFSKEQLDEFLNEGQKLAAMGEIAGVVKVHDADKNDGAPYLVSDYIDGKSLSDRIKSGPVPFKQAAEIIRSLAQTLHQTHLRGLTHRDIKPANILLDQKSNPYLADFGLAVMEDDQWREAPSILGTYSYMPPEQARGESHLVDGRADIFSLGMVFYQLLTQRLPYTADTREGYVSQILSKEPRPPRMINDLIPDSLERICLKCIKKNVGERYSTASDLVRELDLALQTPKKSTSRAWAIGTAATVLIAIGITFLIRQPEPQADQKSPDSAAYHSPLAIGTPHPATVPMTLFSSVTNDSSFFTINAATNHLHLVSEDLYLVKLGTLRDSDEEIEICIDVKQTKTPYGSAGAFVGYRERPDRKWQFQTIELLKSPEGITYSRRKVSIFNRNTPGSRITDPFPSICFDEASELNKLSLRFLAGRLKQVLWNGIVVEDISLDLPEDAMGSNVTGMFGVFADRSVAEFSNYKLNEQSQELQLKN